MFFKLLIFKRKMSTVQHMSWSKNWMSRALSFLHAVCVSCYSISILFIVPRDLLWQVETSAELRQRAPFFDTMFAMSVMYLGFDAVMMLLSPSEGDGTWLIHHIIGGIGIQLIWKTELVWPIGLYFLLTELSTPFLNICWYLIKINRRSTLRFLLSSMMLLITFFGVRWAGGVLLWYYIYINSVAILSYEWYIVAYIFGGCGVITLLNLLWGVKLLAKF